MKKKVKRRQRFGDWVVVDSDPLRDKKYHKKVLCFDEVANELDYVRVDYLLNGMSTKHKSRDRFTHGHSTRVTYPALPKYVYKWKLGKKKFRVASKYKGKTVTWEYFKTLPEAVKFINFNRHIFRNL